MANKMGYNLIADTKEYSRYYGNFRGVDFSSDHTQVADTRFSYLVNMYKDYRNGQGGGVETFPGFRKIPIQISETAQGGQTTVTEVTDIHDVALVHIGKKRTPVFVFTAGEIDQTYGGRKIYYAQEGSGLSAGTFVCHRTTAYTEKDKLVCFEYAESAYILCRKYIAVISEGQNFNITFSSLSDGSGDYYIPTTYVDLDPAGSPEPKEKENEQRNLASAYVINTFVATHNVTEVVDVTAYTYERYYPLSKAISVEAIKVYGATVTIASSEATAGTDGVFVKTTGDSTNTWVDYIEFRGSSIPAKPEDEGHPEGYAGVEIKLLVELEDNELGLLGFSNKILGCTIVAAYDNRIFLSGNPSYPNYIFWCGIPDDDSGIPDPTYWGELNYVRDGVGSSPIMGMFPVADTLCVLKADTIQDGVVYYHSPSIQEGNNVTPITYPSVRGLSGQGLISRNGCANFRDDPVYISAQGLDAIGQLSVRYERATEHRSSLVDAKLLQSDLSQAKLTVWNGYLILYTNDGKAFLADSRATYGNGDHNEYEWYYLEDLGAYEGQADAVRYAQIPSNLLNEDGKLIYGDIEIVEAASDMIGSIADAVSTGGDINDCDVDGFHFAYQVVTETIDGTEVTTYYYCEYTDYVLDDPPIREQTGGTFKPATAFLADGEDLYMATEIGLFKFNFDLRNDDGSFYPYKDGVLIYARNDRSFGSGCATKMDNCGIPHLVKTTAKKSLVIKTRSEYPATMKVKVRTNRNTYNQIARLSDDNMDFERLDFADLHFTDTATSLFAVSEKEKKWVEKQYYIYNDEFNKNFCLFYIAYRYSVSGKYKNK